MVFTFDTWGVRMCTMNDVKDYAQALNEAVAAELCAYRAAAGKTQREIFEAVGISKSKYIRIEQAAVDIGTRDIAAITDYLSVEPRELMQRAQDRADRALSRR